MQTKASRIMKENTREGNKFSGGAIKIFSYEYHAEPSRNNNRANAKNKLWSARQQQNISQ